ncbi:MAG: hypothetical protein ACRCX2_27755 [Paraclostridium sp.]
MRNFTDYLNTNCRLSTSEVFTNVKPDITWIAKGEDIQPTAISGSLAILDSNMKPLWNLIQTAYKNKRIRLLVEETSGRGSSIACLIAKGDTPEKTVAIVNATKYVKIENVYDPKVGDMVKKYSFKDTNQLYELLKMGFFTINYNRAFNSGSTKNMINEVYIDLMADLFSRRFGSVGDGSKFRYITDYFYNRGFFSPEEIGSKRKYNPGEIAVLKINNPKFFDGRIPELTDYLDIISKEFSTLKVKDTSQLIHAAATVFGENAVYILDNHVYMLNIIANASDKLSLFRSMTLNSYLASFREINMALTKQLAF